MVSFGAVAVSGTSDSLSTTCPIAVAGLGTIAAGDILVFAIEMWESASSPVTWPSGTGTWTQIANLVSGPVKLRIAWCRALGTETGNLTATWTGQQWRLGHLVKIPGALASGDPIEITNTATATSGTAVPTTSVTIATIALLLHFGSSDNGTSQTTPPTGWTEAADGNVLRTNHRMPSATGTYTASGGVIATSSIQHAALIAIKPAAGGGTAVGRALETDTASALTRSKRLSPGRALETDSASGVTRSKTSATGRAQETEQVLGLIRTKTMQIGRAVEVDSGASVVRSKQMSVGLAQETDSVAGGLVRAKSAVVGRAQETDTAFALGQSGATPVGRAVEVDQVFGLIRTKIQAIGRAVENDTATAPERRKVLLVGRAIERDIATGLTGQVTVDPQTLRAGLPIEGSFVEVGEPVTIELVHAGSPEDASFVEIGQPRTP